MPLDSKISKSPTDPISWFLPGDTSTAETISVGETISGFRHAGDTDWYAIELYAGQTIDVSLVGFDPVAGSGPEDLNDPFLRVYDSDGVFITGDDDGGGDLDSFLSFTASTSGTYFLEADAYTYHERGQYQLTVESDDPVHPPIEPDDFVFGFLDEPGDTDLYSLDLSAGQRVIIDLKGTPHANGLEDTYLTVMDSDGNVVAENDDFNHLNSRVNFVADAAQTYTVEISSYDDSYSGAYRLETNVIEPALTAEADLIL